MNYIASFGIPVELSLTPKLLAHTKDASSFSGNVIRLFLANDVPVTICSFRGLFSDKDRIAMLEFITKECELTIEEIVQLVSNGFRHNFQNSVTSRKLLAEFWDETKSFLAKHGFDDIYGVPYFP